MADQENSQMISEFTGITGVDADRAKFFLQSSNWKLDLAIETFYNDDQEMQYAENPSELDEDLTAEDVIETPAPPPAAQQPSTAPSSQPTNKSNIFSLSSFQGGNSDDDDDSEKADSEEGQAYYAGGSTHSGQQIIGPDKKKSKNPTGNLFDAAKKHGASVVPGSEEEASNSKKKSYFRGAGYTLGSDVEPSHQVGSSLPKTDGDTEKPQTVIIKFWRNGFSIDSGPLRDFNDPANKTFLDSIAKGEVPAELRTLVRNAEVHVNMEDHREEEYVKAKESLKVFSGKGQMLGSPAPNVVSAPPTTGPTSAASDCQKSVYQVNESKPTTSIQIRLADGTRLVTKFNHDSTIGDIRNVVRNARPNTGNFNLMTTFPNKILTDDDISISDAKLLNAVIVQRMI